MTQLNVFINSDVNKKRHYGTRPFVCNQIVCLPFTPFQNIISNFFILTHFGGSNCFMFFLERFIHFLAIIFSMQFAIVDYYTVSIMQFHQISNGRVHDFAFGMQMYHLFDKTHSQRQNQNEICIYMHLHFQWLKCKNEIDSNQCEQQKRSQEKTAGNWVQFPQTHAHTDTPLRIHNRNENA